MWLSQQLQEFHCFSLYQGYFEQLMVVMMLLISWKLLEMLPLTLEVSINHLYFDAKCLLSYNQNFDGYLMIFHLHLLQSMFIEYIFYISS